MFMKQYAPNRCEPSIEVSVRRGGGGSWGHGAYNQRIKVIAKMLKKSRVGRRGCQGGYEQRIEVIVKIAKKVEGVHSSPGVGVRVDANDENAKKKKKKRSGWGPL